MFQLALAEAGDPHHVWMVGDNAVADVAGAQAVGIPAILVRAQKGTAHIGLAGAAERILASVR